MPLIPIIGVSIGLVLILVFVPLYIRGARRDAEQIRQIWADFAATRGWDVDWSSKPLWSADYGQQSYRIHGLADGVPIVIELTQRGFNSTAVRAPIVVPEGTPIGVDVLEDTLEPRARELWRQIRSDRKHAALAVWPQILPGPPPRRGEGHRVTVEWVHRERDPAHLAMAIELVAALSRRPPTRYGPGSTQAPHFLRD